MLHVLSHAGHVLHLHQPCPVRLPQPQPADGDQEDSLGHEEVPGLAHHQAGGEHGQDSGIRGSKQGKLSVAFSDSWSIKFCITVRDLEIARKIA